MKAYKINESYDLSFIKNSNIIGHKQLYNDFIDICRSYHIPSSKITDDDIEYMSYDECSRFFSTNTDEIITFAFLKNSYKGYDISRRLERNRRYADYLILINKTSLLRKIGTTSQIKTDREKRKNGAFKTSEQHRELNINKFLDIILNKYDFSTLDASFLSTKKIFRFIYASRYPLFLLYSYYTHNELEGIMNNYNSMITMIQRNIDTPGRYHESDITNRASRIKTAFRNIMKSSTLDIYSAVLDGSLPQSKEMKAKMDTFKPYLLEYYNSMEIKSPYDLQIEFNKISTMNKYLNNGDNSSFFDWVGYKKPSTSEINDAYNCFNKINWDEMEHVIKRIFTLPKN